MYDNLHTSESEPVLDTVVVCVHLIVILVLNHRLRERITIRISRVQLQRVVSYIGKVTVYGIHLMCCE